MTTRTAIDYSLSGANLRVTGREIGICEKTRPIRFMTDLRLMCL